MGRIVIFAKRRDTDGNADVVFDVTTPEEREQRTGELSKQGYEVYSGPAASDELPPEA